MGREKKRAAGAHAQLRKRKEKGDSRERRRYDLRGGRGAVALGGREEARVGALDLEA